MVADPNRNLRVLPARFSISILLVAVAVISLFSAVATPATAQATKPIPDLKCPVSGYSYAASPDWGAPRDSGGWHAGHDMFADPPTPVVAVEGGQAEYAYGTVAGFYVLLRADSGNVYYYAHLAQHDDSNLKDPNYPMKDSVKKRVEVGEKVGTVSNTGNAKDTPPHLHFGFRYRSLLNHVNPQPYIRQYC